MARILIVDDEPDNLVSLQAILNTHLPDCEVLAASSGRQAIDLARDHLPDVILLDVFMPGMDGYEVCRRLKEDRATARIPVVMVTAVMTETRDKVRGLECGADAFLTKPVEQAELVAQVRVALRLKKAEDALLREMASVEDQLVDRTRELRESERRLQGIMDSLPGAAYRWQVGTDGAYRLVFVSRGSVDLLGYEPQEVQGWEALEVFRLIHPDDRPLSVELSNRALKGRVPGEIFCRMKTKSGDYRWVHNRFQGITGRDGRLTAVEGMLLDASQMKEAERLIRWEASVNRDLADLARTLVAEKDPETVGRKVVRAARDLTESELGMIVTVNPHTREQDQVYATESVLEQCRLWSGGDLTVCRLGPDGDYAALCGHGLNIGEPFYTNDPPGHPLWKGLPQGHVDVRRFLSVPISLNGDVIGQLMLANPPRDYTDRELRVAGWLGDLFALAVHRHREELERRRLEDQLRQAQKMEALGTLAGGVAHDFNNILSAIIGYAELGLMDLPDRHPVRECLEEVIHSGKRARDVVRQILTFSRARPAEREPVLVEPILKETLKFLRASLPSTIEIRKDLCDTDALVRADPGEIHQVLLNLGTNAAYAMRDTGGVLTVRLETTPSAPPLRDAPHVPSGPYVKLTVQDTGEGMLPEVRERIFDPYFTTKPVGEGTGLGLAVVHGIVRSAGGCVEVESAPGRGSTFRIYLPRVEAPPTEVRSDPKRAVLRGHERVLVVDDEPALVQMVKTMLSRFGYRVEGAGSPEEVLQRLREDPGCCDVLLTDLTMPGMTGLVLAEKALSIRGDLPVVLMTGFGDRVDQERLKRAGIHAVLGKPFAANKLTEALRRAVEGGGG
ncbi:MAG: response regulator [Desulfacinum sp.]|nr:response regulator [Desulfacinum sp.]